MRTTGKGFSGEAGLQLITGAPDSELNWLKATGGGGGEKHLGSSLHSSRGSDVEAPLPEAQHGLVAALPCLHNARVNLLQTQSGELRSTKEPFLCGPRQVTGCHRP